MREIGKRMQVDEIKELDIISINNTKEENKVLVYNISEDFIYVLLNLCNKREKFPERFTKTELGRENIFFHGNIQELEPKKKVTLKDITDGTKFMLPEENNSGRVYIKTGLSLKSKIVEINTCVELESGDIKMLSENSEVISLYS